MTRIELDGKRCDHLRKRLRGNLAAQEALDQLDWWGLTKRQARFTDDEMIAHCVNMAEQRARRVSHDTGATRDGRML